MKNLLSLSFVLFLSVMVTSCEIIDDLINHKPTAKEKKYSAFLSGFEEVQEPAVKADGAGQASFTLSSDEKKLSFKLIVSNTDHIIFAHIHLAPVGENGLIVVTLLPHQTPSTGLVNGVLAQGEIMAKDLSGPLEGKTLSDLIKAIETGKAYVNVHTDEYPAGELRGQVKKAPAKPVTKFTTLFSGSEEVPPVTTSALGEGTFEFNSNLTELKFRVDVMHLNNPLFSHIHLAPKGVNGGVVVFLRADKVEGEVNGKYAEGTITKDDLKGALQGGPLSVLHEAMVRGYTYGNIHTKANPPGEIRGQIIAK